MPYRTPVLKVRIYQVLVKRRTGKFSICEFQTTCREFEEVLLAGTLFMQNEWFDRLPGDGVESIRVAMDSQGFPIYG